MLQVKLWWVWEGSYYTAPALQLRRLEKRQWVLDERRQQSQGKVDDPVLVRGGQRNRPSAVDLRDVGHGVAQAEPCLAHGFLGHQERAAVVLRAAVVDSRTDLGRDAFLVAALVIQRVVAVAHQPG